jgi:DNA-directed RNA polymerase specialized sigma24 family protein
MMTYTEVYEENRELWIERLKRRLAVTREDAEDLVQSAFLKTFNNPPSHPSLYKPHLWQRALGDGQNLVKKYAERGTHVLINEGDSCLAREYRDCEEVEDKDAVTTYLAFLNESDAMLLMSSAHGASTTDLANELGIAQRTVQVKQQAAREFIKSMATAV